MGKELRKYLLFSPSGRGRGRHFTQFPTHKFPHISVLQWRPKLALYAPKQIGSVFKVFHCQNARLVKKEGQKASEGRRPYLGLGELLDELRTCKSGYTRGRL